MSAGNILQIGAAVDIAEFKAGMEQAAQNTRAAAGEMSQAFQALAAESQATTTEISSAWVRTAESSVAFARAKDQVRAASRAAKQAEDDDAAALANLALAQQRAATAAAELAAAQKATMAASSQAAGAAEELAAATGHTGAQMAYASGAIRVFEGTLPIRAVERFITTTLGLGPLLTAAFPIVGLIALSEMLVRIAGKVVDLYENFVELKDVQEELIGVEERLARATIASFEQTQRLAEEHLRNTGKLVDAAQLHLQNLQSRPIDLGQFLKTDEIDKKLKELPEAMREDFKRTFTSILPGDISGLIDRLKTSIGKAQSEIESAQRTQTATEAGAVGSPYGAGSTAAPGMFTERDVNQQKALIEIYSGLLQHLQQLQEQTAAETQVATDQVGRAHEEEARKAEEAARRIQAAMRQKVDALRASDEEALDDMRSAGTLSLGTEQRFLEQRLAVEAAYPERVRALRHQLSEVLQREAQEQIKIHVALVKSVEENNRAMEEAEKQDTAALQKDLDERLRQEQENLKQQQEIDKTRLEGALEADEQQVRMQQAQLARQQSLGGSGWNPLASKAQELAALREQQALEERILALKIEQARIDAESATDDIKREQALNRLAAAQAQYNLKVYEDQTKTLQLQQEQYQRFFNTVNDGLSRAVTSWISGQQKFSTSMARMWNDMVTTFLTNLLKMELQWVENELVMTLTHQAGNTARVASDATAAAQSQSISLASALQQQLAAAKVAAGNTWAAVSAIPVIGPILAPPAAAAAFAAVLAFEQGGLVPATGLAMLHANEMVLPAALSQHVMDTAGGGGATGGGVSSVHVHYSPTINGSGSDLKSMLSAHADHIGNIVRQQMRKGRLQPAL